MDSWRRILRQHEVDQKLPTIESAFIPYVETGYQFFSINISKGFEISQPLFIFVTHVKEFVELEFKVEIEDKSEICLSI